jgi:hypothetical protein
MLIQMAGFGHERPFAMGLCRSKPTVARVNDFKAWQGCILFVGTFRACAKLTEQYRGKNI